MRLYRAYNNLESTLSSGVGTTDTVFNITDTLFMNIIASLADWEFTYFTLDNSASIEIVELVSLGVGNSINVIRNKFNTGAQIWPSGTQISCRLLEAIVNKDPFDDLLVDDTGLILVDATSEVLRG